MDRQAGRSFGVQKTGYAATSGTAIAFPLIFHLIVRIHTHTYVQYCKRMKNVQELSSFDTFKGKEGTGQKDLI